MWLYGYRHNNLFQFHCVSIYASLWKKLLLSSNSDFLDHKIGKTGQYSSTKVALFYIAVLILYCLICAKVSWKCQSLFLEKLYRRILIVRIFTRLKWMSSLFLVKKLYVHENIFQNKALKLVAKRVTKESIHCCWICFVHFRAESKDISICMVWITK